MYIRNVKEDDYLRISTNLNTWWGGRSMVDMLPRLFITHFQDTSFIIEDEGETLGFVIGFISPSKPALAYIHFVGVNPRVRQKNIGRRLYEHFFQTVQARGCQEVQCVTSPINKLSIKFHTGMGFEMKEGDLILDSVPVHQNYDGVGEDRVVFRKSLK
jgi:ribosomal protein S18 acetylase RimI-like enzyme